MHLIDEAVKYGFNLGLFLAGAVGAFVKMGKKDELTFWQRFLYYTSRRCNC